MEAPPQVDRWRGHHTGKSCRDLWRHGQRESKAEGHCWKRRRRVGREEENCSEAHDRNWQAEGSAWKQRAERRREPEPCRKHGEWKVTRHADVRDWRWHLKMGKDACSADSIGNVCDDQVLPFHLIVEHILVRLPVRQICQVRCVCKAWNSVLTGKFLKAEEEEEYWLVLVTFPSESEVKLMALSSHGCYHPLPLPNSRLLSYLRFVGVSWLPAQSLCLASAGGLMCAIVKAKNGFDVVVFNCLTGSLKVLPQPLEPEKMFLAESEPGAIYLAVDAEDPSRYYVMLANSYLTKVKGDLKNFEIFDSGTGSWKVGQEAHTMASASNVPHGDFFNVGSATSSKILNMQAYHVAQDAWSTVQVPSHSIKPYTVTPGAILKYKGRILQGFLLFTDDTYGFGVWELQITSSETGTWVEVARTPEHLFQSRQSSSILTVEAQGRLFYMFSAYISRGNIGHTLVYDIAHNTWSVMPSMDGVYAAALHQPMSSMYLV